MRTTWSDDCDRAIARAQCGQRGEPNCLQLGCPRCAQEQVLKTQFEYEVIALQTGETAALKSAVKVLGETRAHVSRTEGLANALLDAYRYLLQEQETGESTVTQYRAVMDRAARALRNAGIMRPQMPVEEVLCVYCGGNEHATESPAGERCRAEQDHGEAADEAAARADRIADEARDEAALADLEDRATQDALTQEAENINADEGRP